MATAGNPEVDLTNKAPSRAVDHFAGLPVAQHSAMLRHCTGDEGKAPLFVNFDKGLEYLRRKSARLEKQRKVERLRS
jgi:hypothetical protein